MAYRSSQKEVIRKVLAVGDELKKRTDKAGWLFKGDNVPEWPKEAKDFSGKEGKMYKESDSHHVMWVKHADGNLNQEKFLISVPEHFFDIKGEFTADPVYNTTEVLYIKFTGDGTTGTAVNWVDLNYSERGGNGGGGGGVTEIGCAKWS